MTLFTLWLDKLWYLLVREVKLHEEKLQTKSYDGSGYACHWLVPVLLGDSVEGSKHQWKDDLTVFLNQTEDVFIVPEVKSPLRYLKHTQTRTQTRVDFLSSELCNILFIKLIRLRSNWFPSLIPGANQITIITFVLILSTPKAVLICEWLLWLLFPLLRCFSTWKWGLEMQAAICLKSGSWIRMNWDGSITSRISSISPRNIT